MNLARHDTMRGRAADVAGVAWDAIVIGAGVAGGTAACVAADAGLRVLLVEKSAFPRPKVCGGCLSARGVRALERAGLGGTLTGSPHLQSLSLRWGDRRADARFASHRVVARPAFDLALLHAAADRGVTILQPMAAKVIDEGQVLLGGDDVATASMVIVCDGLGGTSLSGIKGLAWTIAARSRMGLGATLEASASSLACGTLVMRCCSEGYLGVVRLGDGRLDMAAAIDPATLREGRDAGSTMAGLFADGELPAESLARARWRGTPLLTRRRCRVATARTMVVGDAAGYVEPFTGEGMTWAIDGAVEAASIAARVVRHGGDATAWSHAHERLLMPRRRACSVVASVLRSERAARSLVSLAAKFPSIAERGARLVAGVTA